MANALFVDVSSFQHPGLFNWPSYRAWSMAADGISRLLLRADQGVGVKDSAIEQFWAAAIGVGIDELLVYHYAYPNLHPGTSGAAAEAASLEQVIGKRLRAHDKVMLDLEQNESSAWAVAFGQQMATWHPTSSKPVLYDSLSHVATYLNSPQLPALFDLALADWTLDPNSRPKAPTPWPGYAWLQYTDRLTAPWYPGPVDANVFLGKDIPMDPSYVLQPDGSWLPNTPDARYQHKVSGWILESLKAVINPERISVVLGWPTEDAHHDPDGRWRQTFQHLVASQNDSVEFQIEFEPLPTAGPTGTAKLVITDTSITAVMA